MAKYIPIPEATHRANAKAAKQRAKDKAAERLRKSQLARDVARDKHYQHTYDLTLSEVTALFEAQDYKCALCEGEVALRVGSKRATGHVDHCHETGRIRGILCGSCNTRVSICERVDITRILKYLRGW